VPLPGSLTAPIKLSADGNKVATAAGKNLIVHNTVTDQTASSNIDALSDWILAVGWHSDSTRLMATTNTRRMGLFDATSSIQTVSTWINDSSLGIGDGFDLEWTGSCFVVGHTATSGKPYEFSSWSREGVLQSRRNVDASHDDNVTRVRARPGFPGQYAAVNEEPEGSGHNYVYHMSSCSMNLIGSSPFAPSIKLNGACAWTPGGDMLAVGSNSSFWKQVFVYNAADLGASNPSPAVIVGVDGTSDYGAFSSDGTYLAIMGSGNSLEIFETSSWAKVFAIQLTASGKGLAWLPGSHTLVTGGGNALQYVYLDDLLPPQVEITTPPAGFQTTDDNVGLTGFITDSGSGVWYAEYRINGGTWNSLSLDGSDAFLVNVGLAVGATTIEVRGWDNAGWSTTETRLITRLSDIQPPTIASESVSPTGRVNPTDQVTISAVVTDANSGVDDAYVVALIQAPDESDVTTIGLARGPGDEFSGIWDTTAYASQTYWIDLRAADNEGNVAESENIGVVIINQTPQIQIITPSADTDLLWGQSYVVSWSAQDPDSAAIISCYLDDDFDPDNGKAPIPGGVGLPEDTLSLDLQAEDFGTGTYYVYCKISDEYGSAETWSIGRLIISFPDCNGNGAPDDDDITAGTSHDCNGNAAPDECDLLAGTSQDCNTTGIPDDCELSNNDCNGDQTPDDCQVFRIGDLNWDGNVNLADYAQFSACVSALCTAPPCDPPQYADNCCWLADFDEDGDVDLADYAALQIEMEIAECLFGSDCGDGNACTQDLCVDGTCENPTIGCPKSEVCDPSSGLCVDDCNSNGLPDDSDIAGGSSIDADSNGIPDECEDEPVGYYQLNGDTGDCSGYGNHGTLIGNPAYGSGIAGYGLVFDGDGDYFQVNQVPDMFNFGAGDFSFSLWFQSSEGTEQQLLSHHTYQGAGYELVLRHDGPVFFKILDNAGTVLFAEDSGDYMDGAWHQVAVTRAGSTACLWIDGVQSACDTNAQLGDTNCTCPLYVGYNRPGGPRFMTGGIDELRLYDRALTSTEIQYLFANPGTGVCVHDCNTNGLPDANEIAAGTAADCNNNTVPDDCDIAYGTSSDDDTNSIPDECEDTCSAELDLGNGVVIELVRIPAGSFMMGSMNGVPNATPVHTVTFNSPFYMSRFEVTQAQWSAVMGANPSHFPGSGDLPVESVSWNDAVTFCNIVSAMAGYRVRLPSEAEWEYATRAGSSTEYPFGQDAGMLGDYAWYDANSGNKTWGVGIKTANTWGLSDTLGNVGEWCADHWHADYTGAPPDGRPWVTDGDSSRRLTRGGSWLNPSTYFRSAYRTHDSPDYTLNYVGFRVAVTYADCNSNGVFDVCDVSGGISLDSNTNGVPDECALYDNCSSGWHRNPGNGHCYAFQSEMQSWEDAQSSAQADGGYLVTINDANEQAWLDSLWPIPPFDNLHIGLQLNGGEWQWVTGEPLVFTNWNPGEPSGGGSEPYGEMNNHSGYPGGWNDTAASMQRAIVECEGNCGLGSP
jgi:formylglycine-generating enzyme required for sulfatase activity